MESNYLYTCISITFLMLVFQHQLRVFFFYDLNEMVCLDFLPLELWKFCSKWAGICIHTTKYLYRVEFCVYFLSMQTTMVLLSSNHLNV